MVSLFPSLLAYQFFALAILRIVAGLYFLWIAYFLFTRRREIAREEFPVIRRFPAWATLLYSIVVLATSVLLLVGLYTQAAAIAGLVVSLDHFAFARSYPRAVAISSAASLLLFVICLVLLLSGAGALAFDLPL